MSLHYGLLTAAVALSLLPGCAWLRGTRNAKRDATPTQDSDSSNATKIAGDRAPAAVVGLDGSAAADGAPKIPNAPAMAATAPQAGADAAEQLTTAAPEAGKKNKLNAGKGPAGETDDEEQPDGTIGASASGSGAGVAPADLRTEAVTTPSAAPGETLTNLPGSFDVVGDGVRVEQGVVAATVNGHPIFVEDVIRDLPIDFAKAEKDMPPDQYRDWRRQIIEMHLQRPIEEELLLQALKIKLKPEQIKGIGEQIDAMFNKEILPSVMKQQGFDTEAEFERALRAKGSSVEMLRAKNRNREYAQQYIGAKVMPKAGFDLPDLRKYYKEHKNDYAIVAQAKWEQIQLKYSKNGGKEQTLKKAAEIVKRLQGGEDFGAIARESSNGPGASRGGARGWTPRGSLADEVLDEALFAQPLQEIGSPIEGKEAIDIVRVVDRTAAGYKPFSAVQDDIKAHLKDEEWTKASKALFQDLNEHATIVKMTDKL